MQYLRRRLREVGPAQWERIAAAAGVSPRLPSKIAYGDRDNPRVQTIQPLLDYFSAVDRGEIDLPPETAAAAPPGHVALGRTDGGSLIVAEAQ